MRLIPSLRQHLLAIALTASLVGPVATPNADAQELQLSGEIRERMDSWELNRINAADRSFAEALEQKDERKRRRGLQQASAAYQLFLEEFPQSAEGAIAYALYRQARAQHLTINARRLAVRTMT